MPHRYQRIALTGKPGDAPVAAVLTQLATLLFASKNAMSLWTVFLAASAALVLTSAIGVAAGALVSQYVNPRYLSYAAGIGFVAIGAWILVQAGTVPAG